MFTKPVGYALLVCMLLHLSTGAEGQRIHIPADTKVEWEKLPSFDELIVAGHLSFSGQQHEVSLQVGRISVVEGGQLSLKQVTLQTSPGLIGSWLEVEAGGHIDFSYVTLNAVRQHTNNPLINWRGHSGKMSNVAINYPGNILALSGNGLSISNSSFTTTDGIALELAPAGLAQAITIKNNTFDLSGEATGIRCRNLAHTISGNTFRLQASAVGIAILPLEAYRYFDWSKMQPASSFKLEQNRFVGTSSRSAIGIRVGHFNGLPQLNLKASFFNSLAVGIEAMQTPIRLDHATFKGNALAIQAQSLSANHLSIEGSQSGDEGILLDAKKENHLWLELAEFNTLERGISVTGALAPSNQLKDVNFIKVKYKLSLREETSQGFVRIEERASTFTKILTPAANEPHSIAHDGHNSHTAHLPESNHRPVGLIVHSSNLRRSPSCQLLDDHENWYVCPDNSLGTLTLATGHGLDDPIHEHLVPLGKVNILSVNSGEEASLDANDTQISTIELAGGQQYRLDVDGLAHFYDLALEWNGSTPLRVSIPYPHAHPTVLHTLGRKVQRVFDMSTFKATKQTAYLVDPIAKEIQITLYPAKGGASVSIYSNEVDIPVLVNGQQVKMSQAYSDTLGLYFVELTNPHDRLVSVSLTDIYGTPIGELITQTDTSYAFDVSSYSGHGGWVWVSSGQQLFKGPLLLEALSKSRTTSFQKTQSTLPPNPR